MNLEGSGDPEASESVADYLSVASVLVARFDDEALGAQGDKLTRQLAEGDIPRTPDALPLHPHGNEVGACSHLRDVRQQRLAPAIVLLRHVDARLAAPKLRRHGSPGCANLPGLDQRRTQDVVAAVRLIDESV
jgi:hypothetical protein